MEGFKSLPKMAHFKEGGSVAVKNIMKKGGKVAKHDDVAEDKKLIKKAFGMHDSQLHEDQKTDLSGLKKGGRSKKETGTVRKFKTGGSVSGAKGPSGSTEAKRVAGGPKKADAPSKASVKAVGKIKSDKPAGDASPLKRVASHTTDLTVRSAAGKGDNGVSKYKCGGKIKKMQVGGSSGPLAGIRDAILGTPAQNEIAKQNEARYLRAKQLQQASGQQMSPGENMAMGLAGLGQQLQPAAPAAPAAPVPAQKRGGKAGKC
jgi:hypothetical protein